MNVREFSNSDSPAVKELWQKCNLVVPWNDPQKDIDRKMLINPELFLVAELDGQIIGSIMGGYDGHRGWVNYLAVAPSHQHKGYGALLMKTIEDLLKSMGCPKINLQIRSTNKGVIEFYKSIDYKIDDVVSMGKRLISD